jgi:NTP pyrophosphatase (non-canonical NTP hydrolase)|tara:strand:- start:1152 stop:1442 length:291 start_codon:yes stop_codon:yes gene_type:complete
MGAQIDNTYYIATAVQDRVFHDVLGERKRQDDKWGDQLYNTNERWNVIGVEEVGEVAKSILDRDKDMHLYEEIVQVAAVYVAWAESLQRLGGLNEG